MNRFAAPARHHGSRRPDGSSLVSRTFVFTSGRTLSATLSTSGTHAIVIDPQSSETGSMTVTLTPGT
jgi:hypothetical protein